MPKLDHFLRALGVILFRLSITAVVAVAWIVSALANYTHADQISNHAPIMIGAALVADIFKALIPMSMAAAWRQRAWAVVIIGALVWPVCMVYSVKSATGFITGTLTDYKAGRSKDGVASSSIVKQIDTATASLAEMVDSKIYGAASQRAYWDGEIAKTEAKITELSKQLKTEKAIGDADPFSALLVTHLGLSDTQTTLIAVVSFLLILETLSTFGATLAAPLLVSPAPQAEAAPTATEAEPEDTQLLEQTAAPHLRVVPTSVNRTALSNAEVMRTRRLHKAQCREFISHLRHQVGEGVIQVAVAQKHYADWVAGTKWDPLKPNLLGQQLLAAGCERATDAYGRPAYQLPKNVLKVA